MVLKGLGVSGLPRRRWSRPGGDGHPARTAFSVCPRRVRPQMSTGLTGTERQPCAPPHSDGHKTDAALLTTLLRALLWCGCRSRVGKLRPGDRLIPARRTFTIVSVRNADARGSLGRRGLSPAGARTVESFSFLDVQERSRAPDPDRPVVRGAGQQSGQDGVPAHAVDGARVTAELCDGQLAAPVPDVDLVV